MATVTIENHGARYRLRWLYQGKRYTMSCGVPATPTGKAIAKQKAAQIELDISAGYFDPTLLKYKPRTLGKTATEISAVDLFERYAQAMKRDKALTRNAFQKYTALLSHLKAFFGTVGAESVGDRRAGDFSAYLLERMVDRPLNSICSCFGVAGIGQRANIMSRATHGLTLRERSRANPQNG